MIKKYRIRLTEDEQNIIINGLLNWRNQLIKEGKYTTDAIDDLLLKLLDRSSDEALIRLKRAVHSHSNTGVAFFVPETGG